MKKIIVSVPYGKQITEDHWVKCHITKEFTENSTVKEILDFVAEICGGDISGALITALEE